MRRKDREMDREFALAVTDKCEYATLAMAAKDGEPYGVPVTSARDGEKIYFHCAKAVSYTHLDVYKRQVRPSASSFADRIGFMTPLRNSVVCSGALPT